MSGPGRHIAHDTSHNPPSESSYLIQGPDVVTSSTFPSRQACPVLIWALSMLVIAAIAITNPSDEVTEDAAHCFCAAVLPAFSTFSHRSVHLVGGVGAPGLLEADGACGASIGTNWATCAGVKRVTTCQADHRPHCQINLFLRAWGRAGASPTPRLS